MAYNLPPGNPFSFHSLTPPPARTVLPDLPKVEEAPFVGGYDDEFVNAVEDDLQCSICHLPLKYPVQTKCGHRFCETCLDEHFKRFAFLIYAKWLLFISLRSAYVCEQIHSFSSYVWFWAEFLVAYTASQFQFTSGDSDTWRGYPPSLNLLLNQALCKGFVE